MGFIISRSYSGGQQDNRENAHHMLFPQTNYLWSKRYGEGAGNIGEPVQNSP